MVPQLAMKVKMAKLKLVNYDADLGEEEEEEELMEAQVALGVFFLAVNHGC